MDADIDHPRTVSPEIEELDRVRLLRAVSDSEGSYEAASTGTVVHVYRDGQAYEVELFQPRYAVVTIERADVELLSD